MSNPVTRQEDPGLGHRLREAFLAGRSAPYAWYTVPTASIRAWARTHPHAFPQKTVAPVLLSKYKLPHAALPSCRLPALPSPTLHLLPLATRFV